VPRSTPRHATEFQEIPRSRTANVPHCRRVKSALRLDQLLSRFGYCSRSQARFWLKAGRVTVNGVPARTPEDRVEIDTVRIDGEPVEQPQGLLVVLHKPAGVVCSRDPREGRNVFELVPPRWSERNPAVTTIGRLDRDTTGVLVLTDQGELVQRWTSPRHKVPKVYDVTLDAPPSEELPALFASGTMRLDGEREACAPAVLELLGGPEVRLTLTEGRFHQVKRMFAAHGRMVTRLHRSLFGTYRLDNLAPGEWRFEPLPA